VVSFTDGSQICLPTANLDVLASPLISYYCLQTPPECGKEGMMEILIVLIVLVALDIAASRWGFNSIEGVDSPEWERRQLWYGFH
jgi:hypothetical protein